MSGLFAVVVVVFSSGNLQSRRLGEIVKKEDLVDSEYLTTLLVLVARCDTLRFLKLWFFSTCIVYKLMFVCVCFCFHHRANYQQWESSYESLSDLVVPRSSR